MLTLLKKLMIKIQNLKLGIRLEYLSYSKFVGRGVCD